MLYYENRQTRQGEVIEVREKSIHKSIKVIAVLMLIIVAIYIVISDGGLGSGNITQQILVESEELFNFDVKENAYIGVNNKQIYKVTKDGIKAYNLDKEEVWSDTFTLNEVVVKQKSPYIVVGSRGGKSIHVFNEKGKQAEINAQSEVVYFSINENGNVVTIEDQGNKHHVTAYSPKGDFLCTRTSYVETDGYPTVAEISPNGETLLVSYVSTKEPEVVSTIIGINTKDNKNKEHDNVMYGLIERDNLVYSIGFLSEDTWVSIGDSHINWYDEDGNHKVNKQGIHSVFVPQIPAVGVFKGGYLPLIVSSKPIQSTIHQDEKLVVFDSEGKEVVNNEIKEGVTNLYVSNESIVYETGGKYEGYNRLGNKLFTYSPTIDINRVIYFSDLKEGIAINKEKVVLLTPKSKEDKK